MNKRRIIVRAMAAAAAGSGLKVPYRDLLIQWLKGLNDDSITLTDKIDPLLVDPAPTLVGVNCLAYDAVSTYLSMGTEIPTDYPFTMSAWVNSSSTESFKYFLCLGSDTTNTFCAGYMSGTGAIAIIAADGSQKGSLSNETFLNENVYVELRFISETQREIWYSRTDETNLVEVTYSSPNNDPVTCSSGMNEAVCGIRKAGTYAFPFDGKIARPRIRQGDVDIYYQPCEEGAEETTYDVSGEGNHGTFGDGVTPATFPTWTTLDGIPSWNHAEGFRVAVQGDPPYIPALSSSVYIAIDTEGNQFVADDINQFITQ